MHHIIALNGENRIKNVLTRQDNLIVLRKKCHQKRHKNHNASSLPKLGSSKFK